MNAKLLNATTTNARKVNALNKEIAELAGDKRTILYVQDGNQKKKLIEGVQKIKLQIEELKHYTLPILKNKEIMVKWLRSAMVK